MRAFIVSDHDPISGQVRQVLLREGLECPANQVHALDYAADLLAQTAPELVVVVLSPNPERALVVLGELRFSKPARVLAVGPTHDSRLVLRSLRSGADDYVDEADLEAELQLALARLGADRSASAQGGHLVAVLAPSGGSGSSTLAANVATVLAQEHKTSALIDLKLEAGDLAALLDLKPTHTLADLCQQGSRMDRSMFERSVVRHASGVHLLAPPHSFADIGYVTADGVRQTLGLARSLFPYVVVDLDHPSREEQLQAIRQADVILIVFRLEFAALRNTQRTLDYLEQVGGPADRIRLVVNRYGQPKEIPYAKVEEALRQKIFHYVPDDPKTVNRANNNGVPVVLESPSAAVSRSITKLSKSVNGRHKST